MPYWRYSVVWCCTVLVAATAFCGESAQNLRSQTIQLRRGWNAVFLEVYPVEASPSALFANTPIDIVAAYYARGSSAQFMANPGVDLFKKQGWGVWYAENRPDAFLKSLFSIFGQQGYLIHAKADYTWTLTGSTVTSDTHWEPGAYNFVGFAVRAQGAPTFAQFFDGSPAHRHNKIYRLQDGAWRRVLDPGAEAMRSGEAFWIYCDGASKYPGPIAVETAARGGLVLGASGGALTLRNQTGHPLTATVEHVPSGTNSVPLSIPVQIVGDPNAPVQSIAARKPAGAWTQPLPPLEAGAALRLPFELRVEDMQSLVHGSLLKVSTDLGTENWIPVIAMRPDLEAK